MDALTAVISVAVGFGGATLGAFLARRNDRRAQAERLLVEALNDAVQAITSVAGGVGLEAQRQYAFAVSRVALHASPAVVQAFRRFQDVATTTTEDGRWRLLDAVNAARGELGHELAAEEDLAVLLFGGPVDVELWAEKEAEVRSSVDALWRVTHHGSADETREPELDRLRAKAEIAPREVVVGSFQLIEAELHRMAAAHGVPQGPTPAALADILTRGGHMTRETLSAIKGLVALRNLAEHAGDVDGERAREYVAFVEAVLFALSRPPRS